MAVTPSGITTLTSSVSDTSQSKNNRVLVGHNGRTIYINDAQSETEQKVIDYIRGMKKDELQQELFELLFDGPEWQYERFVRRHIE